MEERMLWFGRLIVLSIVVVAFARAGSDEGVSSKWSPEEMESQMKVCVSGVAKENAPVERV